MTVRLDVIRDNPPPRAWERLPVLPERHRWNVTRCATAYVAMYKVPGKKAVPITAHPVRMSERSSAARDAENEVQTIVFNETATSGTYDILIKNVDGIETAVTGIYYNGVDFQARLNAAIGTNRVIVSSRDADGAALVWSGAGMAGIDQDMITVDVSGLETTEAVTITEITRGRPSGPRTVGADCRYHIGQIYVDSRHKARLIFCALFSPGPYRTAKRHVVAALFRAGRVFGDRKLDFENVVLRRGKVYGAFGIEGPMTIDALWFSTRGWVWL